MKMKGAYFYGNEKIVVEEVETIIFDLICWMILDCCFNHAYCIFTIVDPNLHYPFALVLIDELIQISMTSIPAQENHFIQQL